MAIDVYILLERTRLDTREKKKKNAQTKGQKKKKLHTTLLRIHNYKKKKDILHDIFSKIDIPNFYHRVSYRLVILRRTIKYFRILKKKIINT